MLQMSKIQKKLNKVNLSSKSLSFNKNYAQHLGPASLVVQRRRASRRIEKEFVKNCSVRETFFTNRVANDWNKLSDEVIEARAVKGFKARYDKICKSTKSYHSVKCKKKLFHFLVSLIRLSKIFLIEILQ
jgi:hypothetical protein